MAKLVPVSIVLVLVALATAQEAENDVVYSRDPIYKHPPIFRSVHPPVGFEQMQGLQGNNHSLILGQRRYGDSLIHIDVAKKSSKLFRIVEMDIKFPDGSATNNKSINFIQVLDRKANWHGGWPYLTKGGVGAKNVTIHFTSERSHGFDFLVCIYGYNS